MPVVVCPVCAARVKVPEAAKRPACPRCKEPLKSPKTGVATMPTLAPKVAPVPPAPSPFRLKRPSAYLLAALAAGSFIVLFLVVAATSAVVYSLARTPAAGAHNTPVAAVAPPAVPSEAAAPAPAPTPAPPPQQPGPQAAPAPPVVQSADPPPLPDIPTVPTRASVIGGVWSVSSRPAWVNDWPENVDPDKGAVLSNLIDKGLQERVYVSISAKPNVLVLDGLVWAITKTPQQEFTAKAVCAVLYVHGFGGSLEIRAAGRFDQPGKLLATYSTRRGLMPVP